jgi:hypothetical protein
MFLKGRGFRDAVNSADLKQYRRAANSKAYLQSKSEMLQSLKEISPHV